MHVEGFLHKLLSSVMHKKRLKTLKTLVTTTIHNKKLSLTELGREMDLPIKESSGIRRADRFLANEGLYAERDDIYTELAGCALGNKKPDIIVDWSNVPNTTHHIIRAALVATGRAITLYEEVHPEKKQENKKVHKAFLKKLKSILPEKCRPVIITDGGFHNDWFKEVAKLGWDYIGRIRAGSGKKYLIEKSDEWKTCASLMKKASSTPKYVGKVLLCKKNPINAYLYLFKGKRKKRNERSLPRGRRCGSNADPRKAAREPWLLVTSLCKGYCMPKKVIEKYTTRMQIEEAFRDLKSSRYGFGFENAYTKMIPRIQVLLLIAMLAAYIAWLTGWVVERMGLHFQFQSNTIKTRRVLSLFYLGCRVIKKRIVINMHEATAWEASCYVNG